MTGLKAFTARLRRAFQKPPGYVVSRLAAELRHGAQRYAEPRFGRRFGVPQLLKRTRAVDLDELWNRLLSSPGWPFESAPPPRGYEDCCPGDTVRIVAAAERASRHEVELLGSGLIDLGSTIDWHTDYKTGHSWPIQPFRKIDYLNRDRPSDVKTVWELSRVQWLLPCGQAYALTGDERFALAARTVLEKWIDANPYAGSVNWCVTMEPALRIFTWGALLRLCGRSRSWESTGFRSKFACALYLHAIFVERFFERSDVNGNHFTADAAALVAVGALFDKGPDADRWFESGLADLEQEIVRQIHPDGVDFEASTAYHRLVAELFLAASMAAERSGRQTSAVYRARLAGMARFTAAYMRPDDTAPLWGDHDDARTLPTGPQSIRDHRYLVGLIALHLGDEDLAAYTGGSRAEACWWFGIDRATRLPEQSAPLGSQAFPAGGAYIISDGHSHVFIDCGPLGLADRGGHGHNDLLSFEAFLDGESVIEEGGCYVYTADFASRNLDRSTSSHNTPLVDGAEINRFRGPDDLWNLIADAGYEVADFTVGEGVARFRGRHTGYHRLDGKVTVSREISYEARRGKLCVRDLVEGRGVHAVDIPLHFAPGVIVTRSGENAIELRKNAARFHVQWVGAPWRITLGACRIAPSYGVAGTGALLTWHARAELPVDLLVQISRDVAAAKTHAGPGR